MTNGAHDIHFRSDAQYGTMPPEDIAYLHHEIVGKWPERDRELLEHKNLTFVVGSAAGNRVSVGPNEVYAHTPAIDYARRNETNKQNVSQLLRFQALIAALGTGPSIDWEGAKEEILAVDRDDPNAVGEMKTRHFISYVLNRAENTFRGQDLNVFRSTRPKLVEVYEQYIRFVGDQIAQMEAQKDGAAKKNPLRLKNGTLGQKEAFDKACQTIPPDVIRAINAKGVGFSVGKVPVNPASISGTNVLISDENFEPAFVDSILPQAIYGHGLAAAFNPKVEQKLLTRAWNEHLQRTYIDSPHDPEGIARTIAESRDGGRLAVKDKDKLGQILSGMYDDSKVTDQTKFAHLLAARHQIHNRYLESARAHTSGQTKVQSGFPTAYAPAPGLPEPERRFFNALNKVVALTGENAVMFDHNLRLKLYTLQQCDSFDMMMQVRDYFSQRIPDVELENVMLAGERPADFPAALKPTLRRNQNPRDPLDLLNFLQEEIAQAQLQFDAQRSLNAFMNQHLPGFDQLSLGPSTPLSNPHIDDLVRDMDVVLGGNAFKEYTGKNLLLDIFARGERDLHTLFAARHNSPVTDYFEVTHVPLGAFLMEGIENTAHFLARDNGRDNDKLRDALAELRAAYRELALTPEEKAAEVEQAAAEAERRRLAHDAEALRSREEALLTPMAYGLNPRLQSIQTRAMRKGPPPPERELGDAWAQMAPLTTLLNRNFAPHLQAGDALFQDYDGQVLAMVDHIATGAPLTHVDHEHYPQRQAQIREALIRVFADPPEISAPQLRTEGVRERLIAANRERHQQVIEALTNAPLLLIATLGAPDMTVKARQLQKELFPPPQGTKKQKPLDETDPELAAVAREEMRYLAGQSVQYAFEQTGREVPASLAAALPPNPPTPPPPPVDRGRTPDWEEVRRRVIDFLVNTLEEGAREGRPYTLFRCRIDQGEPGGDTPHLRVVLARWIPEPGGARLRNDFRELDIGLGNTPLETALQWRHDIHEMVMQQRPFLPDRKLHVPAIANFAELVLPNIPPALQRMEQKDGVWQLHLRFEEPGQSAGVAPHVIETFIPLGVAQRNTRPDDRAQQVLDYLAEMRTPTEGGERIVTAQGVRGWIENRIRGADQPWQGPEISRLDRPATIDVDFPTSGGTRIEVNRCELQGTPTGDWKIPVTFYRMVPNGRGQAQRREIKELTFNTHRGTEQGARDCIPQILAHMKHYLKAYGRQHPDAHWLLTSDGALDQYMAGRDGEHVDLTKLQWMRSGLEYPCQFTVRAVDTTRYEDGRAIGRPTFRMEVLQPDDAPFHERSRLDRTEIPLHREFRIDAEKLQRDEVQRRMTECRDETQRLFSRQLRARFSPRQNGDTAQPASGDPASIPVHFPPADTGWQTVHEYRPQTVRNLFEAAYRGYGREHGIEELPRAAAQEAGGNGGVQPGDPMHHHAPTGEQLEAAQGFRHRVERGGAGAEFGPSL